MVEIVLKLLVLFPAVLGVGEIIHFVKMKILSPKVKPKNYWLIVLNKGIAEEQLKYAILKYAWQNNDYGNLIVITKNISGSELENCRELAQKYGIEFNKNVI